MDILLQPLKIIQISCNVTKPLSCHQGDPVWSKHGTFVKRCSSVASNQMRAQLKYVHVYDQLYQIDCLLLEGHILETYVGHYQQILIEGHLRVAEPLQALATWFVFFSGEPLQAFGRVATATTIACNAYLKALATAATHRTMGEHLAGPDHGVQELIARLEGTLVHRSVDSGGGSQFLSGARVQRALASARKDSSSTVQLLSAMDSLLRSMASAHADGTAAASSLAVDSSDAHTDAGSRASMDSPSPSIDRVRVGRSLKDPFLSPTFRGAVPDTGTLNAALAVCVASLWPFAAVRSVTEILVSACSL
jgi:hypothetical protein